MPFRGHFKSRDLSPSSCGLFNVAEVINHSGREYDERWIRGFDYEFDTYPSVRLLTVNDEVVANGTLYNGERSLRFLSYDPFFVETEDFRSTFDVTGENRFKRVKTQLEAATQKAVERELWEGETAQASSNSNLYLRKSSSATVVEAGSFPPEVALMYLERAISLSPTGESAIIHMTRDVASSLGSYILHKEADEKGPHLITRLGTEIVIGSGYTGNGPIGVNHAAASATNKWMYATTKISVHIGKIEVVPTELNQGVNASVNDMRIKAYRPCAVIFDPSIHYVIRVSVPNS